MVVYPRHSYWHSYCLCIFSCPGVRSVMPSYNKMIDWLIYECNAMLPCSTCLVNSTWLVFICYFGCFNSQNTPQVTAFVDCVFVDIVVRRVRMKVWTSCAMYTRVTLPSSTTTVYHIASTSVSPVTALCGCELVQTTPHSTGSTSTNAEFTSTPSFFPLTTYAFSRFTATSPHGTHYHHHYHHHSWISWRHKSQTKLQ